MKKIYYILSCAALSALTVISCAKLENAEGSPATDLKQGSIRIMVENTKTGFDPGTSKIVWRAGDKVGLFTQNGTLNNTVATLTSSSEGSSSGEFKFNYEGELSGDIYAYYPYAEGVSFSGNYFSGIVLPGKQVYGSLDDAVRNCILAGKQESDQSVHFKNTVSIVQVKLTGSSDLSQVAIWGRDESLSGYGRVNFSNADEPTFEIDPSNVAGSGKSTGAVFASKYTSATSGEKLTTLTSEPYSQYFVIPAGTYAAGDLYIDAVTPEYSMEKIARNSHVFSRNTVKPFNTISVDKPSYSGIIDLGTDEDGETVYSNCFNVKPSSSDASYSFPARAADGSLQYGSDDKSKDSKGATARLVWATSDGLVKNISVDWTAKTIRFDVPGSNTPGSAMIAMVNQYDNALYWVWHIWISDVATISWDGSPVFQDRNLGAEWSPATFTEIETMTNEKALSTSGLLFQYGNCYPFPRANTLEPHNTGKTRNQEATAFGELTQNVVIYRFNKHCQGFSSAGRSMVSNPKNFTMDNLRWYPMTCNYCNESDTDASAGAAWASDVNPYSDNAKYSWGRGTSKARRDPCPAGYKVPSDKQMTYFRRSNGVKESDNHSYYWQYDLASSSFVCSAKTAVNKSYGLLQTTEWKRDAADKGNGDIVWFPKQGVRLGKGFSNAGAMEQNGFYLSGSNVVSGCTMLWSVAPDAGSTVEGNSTVYSGKGSATSTGEFWTATTGNLWQAGFLCTSSACQVRCVKMTDAEKGNSYIDAGSLVDGGTDPNPWE